MATQRESQQKARTKTRLPKLEQVMRSTVKSTSTSFICLVIWKSSAQTVQTLFKLVTSFVFPIAARVFFLFHVWVLFSVKCSHEMKKKQWISYAYQTMLACLPDGLLACLLACFFVTLFRGCRLALWSRWSPFNASRWIDRASFPPATRSHDELANQSIDQRSDRSLLCVRQVCRSESWRVSEPIKQQINQSVDRSIDQSIVQSVNQPFSRSYCGGDSLRVSLRRDVAPT